MFWIGINLLSERHKEKLAKRANRFLHKHFRVYVVFRRWLKLRTGHQKYNLKSSFDGIQIRRKIALSDPFQPI